jgi:hypothetical protein
LRRRYGYEENEAEAAYYLREARDRFTKMYEDEAEEGAGGSGPMAMIPRLRAQMFLMSNVHPHFQALNSLLVERALGRDYPEGWGAPPAREDEGQPE